MPTRFDARCNHVMLRGPKRGHVCGVGCKSAMGGRCAQHRPKPELNLRVESALRMDNPVTVTCSICLEDVTCPGPGSHTTACGHMYHTECIMKVRSESCPMCRAQMGPNRPRLTVFIPPVIATPQSRPGDTVQYPINLSDQIPIAPQIDIILSDIHHRLAELDRRESLGEADPDPVTHQQIDEERFMQFAMIISLLEITPELIG